MTKRLSRVNAPVVENQKCTRRPEPRSQTLSCRREKENVQNCSNSRKYSISTSRKSNIDSKDLDKIELANSGGGSSSSKIKAMEQKKEKEIEVKSDNKKIKKELSKAEKKQLKKEAKAEKKRLKEEAKRLAKDMKHNRK